MVGCMAKSAPCRDSEATPQEPSRVSCSTTKNHSFKHSNLTTPASSFGILPNTLICEAPICAASFKLKCVLKSVGGVAKLGPS